MSKKKNRRGLALVMAGLLLIAAALCLTGYNLWDEHRASEAVRTATAQLQIHETVETQQETVYLPAQSVAVTEPEEPVYIQNPLMEMPVQTVNQWDYIGILEIPALGLSLPVISQWSYPALKNAPCRYAGSAYTDDLVIAAHNYAAHFGSLTELAEGDAVVFTDLDGNVFTYEVAAQETLPPTAVSEMKSGDWDLTLFTCTVGGQYRSAVRCDRIVG